MADSLNLTSIVSSFLRTQSVALFSAVQTPKNQTLLDNLPQNPGKNRIASNDTIAQAINSRNLPRGSLVDITV